MFKCSLISIEEHELAAHEGEAQGSSLSQMCSKATAAQGSVFL